LPLFDLHVVAAATNNFSSENKLGEGGFGPVYKVMPHFTNYKREMIIKEKIQALQKVGHTMKITFLKR